MITAALVFAGFAALLHVYIFVMETLTWTTPRTRAVFGTTAEEAQTTKMLAFNQGFYNLFLAIVTIAGIAAMVMGHKAVGAALVFAGVGSMLAGYGALGCDPGRLPASLRRSAGTWSCGVSLSCPSDPGEDPRQHVETLEQ